MVSLPGRLRRPDQVRPVALPADDTLAVSYPLQGGNLGGQMDAVLMGLYLVAHALAMLAWPAHASLISMLFLALAPLLAAAASAWRAGRDHASPAWWALAIAMVLWALGMVSNLYQSWTTSGAEPGGTPGISVMFFVLYGVPLVFALTQARRVRWVLAGVDLVLAVGLGLLFCLYTFSFATLAQTPAEGKGSLRLMLDIENIFIAVISSVRLLTCNAPAQRVFFRVLSSFAWLYLLVAYGINHFSDFGYGALPDLIIALPFLLLVVMAVRTQPATRSNLPIGLERAAEAASSLILPLAILVVSALLVSEHPRWAVVGFVLATVGFGVRSILLQLDLLSQQDQLDTLARQDGLTGAANRREFDQVLAREWRRASRGGLEMAVVLVDVDCFKQFNDRYGHGAGDDCLRAIAQVLARCASRDSDLVARYGGEEFVVVMPLTSAEGALRLAEQMRLAIEQIELSPANARITASLGVAVLEHEHTASAQELMAAADAALYEAKHLGRNRVVARRVENKNILPP